MSNSYLDRFRSSLPKTQGNQILKILTAKRDSGEIKSVDEFKKKLQELTSTLLEERITPTLKLFDAIAGADTSSEQFNEMLDRIQDDLEAAFVEADTLDEIIAAHQNLVGDIALKTLRYGINELESKITLYEFLNKSTQGFDDAMFNTFRASQRLNTSRSDQAAGLIYVDPRSNQSILTEEDATIDQIGERLIMGADVSSYLSPREAVWLSNSDSIRSEVNVAFKNSRISNIVDGLKGTFWVEPILLRSVRAAGVPMEVCLHMNASQDVNFVEIEPASRFPMVLTGIDYYDSNNNRQSTGASEVTLDGPTRVNFGRITTNSLILKVRQDSYQEVQFKNKPGESNFHRAVLGESSDIVDLDSISEDLQELLSSDFIMTDVMGLRAVDLDQVKYYEYTLGFDNLRAGYSTFQERSIFVSNKRRISKPGRMALRVDEVRPVQVVDETTIALEAHTYPARSSDENDRFYHGVVEYYLIAQFYTDDDFLISTDTIPLLPLAAHRVYHERLVFAFTTSGSQNPDVCQLRFYTDNDSTDVVLYRNATALTHGTDWEFVDPGDVSGMTVTTAGGGKPMKRAVRILDIVRPLDIYTASYTPVVSNTEVIPQSTDLLKTVDMVGDHSVRMVTDNAIVFDDTRLTYPVDYAEVYLVALMRRNSAEQSFSPAVEEYMLVTGSKDTAKFTGD